MEDVLSSAGDIESLKTLEKELQVEINEAQAENNEELKDYLELLQTAVKTKQAETNLSAFCWRCESECGCA